MLITCISASNTKSMGRESASTKVCELIRDMVQKDYNEEVQVNVVPLMDKEVKPCYLCGDCAEEAICKYDDAFNEVLHHMGESDAIFLVVPYYSPIPSKLMIIFEKINEIVYTSYLKDPKLNTPIKGKKIGIIGHGAMEENEKVLEYYYKNLVTPVARTLKGLTFNVIGMNEEYSNGVVFGLKDQKDLYEVEGNLFPKIDHDWDMIKERIRPLVKNIL